MYSKIENLIISIHSVVLGRLLEIKISLMIAQQRYNPLRFRPKILFKEIFFNNQLESAQPSCVNFN